MLFNFQLLDVLLDSLMLLRFIQIPKWLEKQTLNTLNFLKILWRPYNGLEYDFSCVECPMFTYKDYVFCNYQM